MHRVDSSKYLLFIEPPKSEKSEEPTSNELIDNLQFMFDNSIPGSSRYNNESSDFHFRAGSGWRGIHQTNCGEHSSSKDYLLPSGYITNKLCVFYLKYYWNWIERECPSELEKLNKALNSEFSDFKSYKEKHQQVLDYLASRS